MKTIILIAVLITAIHLSFTKEAFAQSNSNNTCKYYEILGDSLVKYTIKNTRFSKTIQEIHIIYNKIENKIEAVEKNGIKIPSDEFFSYKHYIREIESDRQRIEFDLEMMDHKIKQNQMKLESDLKNLEERLEETDLQIRQAMIHLKNDQLLLKNILQKFADELTLKGYQVENKSFKMQIKRYSSPDLKCKIYLGNNLLPGDITKELLNIYTSINGTLNIHSTRHLDFPDGLNVEIKRIETEYE